MFRLGICDSRFAGIKVQVCALPSYSAQENANLHPDSHKPGVTNTKSGYVKTTYREASVPVKELEYVMYNVAALCNFCVGLSQVNMFHKSKKRVKELEKSICITIFCNKMNNI